MLKNTTILIIRHGEKPPTGDVLTIAGQARAQAYITFFQNYKINSEILKINHLFAAASSQTSRRPFLTIEPISKAIGLEINSNYDDKDPDPLVKLFQSDSNFENSNILICWRHSGMIELADALGVEPHLLPSTANWVSKPWPACVFGWILQIRFDEHGNLDVNQTMCISEKLMYNDHGQNPPKAECD